MTQKQQSKTYTARFLLVLLVVAAIFFAGIAIGQKQSPANASRAGAIPTEKDLSIFYEVWQTLDEKYSQEGGPTTKERVWAATKGLTDAYNDPYTTFFPPQEALELEEQISGEFGGVGMEVGLENDVITVIAPLKNSPADQAGIRSGDQIVLIDDQNAFGLRLDEAITLIRGERGTPVTLSVAREDEDELLEITIIRDIIQMPTVETELLEDDVFLIELFSFSETSPLLFREALVDFQESGARKLVLDLRGNPGGLLGAAIDIASWFLPEGKVIVREYIGKDTPEEVLRSKGYDIFDETLEMVVLVDQGSASAAEILAGALAEHGVATLVGEQTFGKGSVQELIELSGRSSLKMTIATWMTPKGVSISEGGLTPEYVVPFTRDDFEAERDPQLEKAIEILK